ncbi:hypothetical protein [Brevibacterium litoralis]|uniref:hypothetical protein n=1 Tax=Brevibacterium litoralis TaxID=3138935 RepID=UPI0032ED71C1
MKRLSRLALAAAAVALSVSTTGCAAMLSAQQTQNYTYNGGDGSWTEVGDVKVRGMLLIANAADEAQMFYTVVNNEADPASVEISVGDTDESFTVPAGEVVVQFPDNEDSRSAEPLVVTGYGAEVGDHVEVDVTINGESTTVATQVLDGNLPEYEDYEPSSPEGDAAEAEQEAAEAAHAEEESGH